MSIFAGIYSRHDNLSIPDHVCRSLKRLISRNALDEVREFESNRTFFVKVDVGAFGGTGYQVDRNGGISLLAGEPLLARSDTAEQKDRESDLLQIGAGFESDDLEALRSADGVFCAANYRPGSEVLSLTTDKLGIRPLYYWADDEFVIFSTALRVLEELAEVPKRMNVRAVTEIAGLGYALSDRTPYRDISVLRAGEIVQFKDLNISRSYYWQWDKIEPSKAPEEDLLSELYRRFDVAVARRLGADTSTVAYLSGGLDSRCVVASICSQNAHVHTFNFARPDTQDQILGRYFADLVNVTHTEVPKRSGDNIPEYSSLLARAWKASDYRQSFAPERPTLAWSGEGGSVDLGHVHLGRRIVELMRLGRTSEAIDEYIQREQIYVSSKVLQPDVFRELSGIIPTGIGEELAELHAVDPARSFYLFLMLNDQRRKLAGHFENVDLHRLEFQLPFFDSSFVECIVSIPVDMCLEHKLYVKWLSLFPKAVTSVPWQAYPGHEPCPLEVPEGLSYQWEAAYLTSENRSLKRALNRQAADMLKSRDFPAGILSKKNIRLAAIVHRTGWRDYGYIIETAGIFHRYWKKCDGEYSV